MVIINTNYDEGGVYVVYECPKASSAMLTSHFNFLLSTETSKVYKFSLFMVIGVFQPSVDHLRSKFLMVSIDEAGGEARMISLCCIAIGFLTVVSLYLSLMEPG